MRLIEALISALMVAGLYATMSYGLALIYGVMKIINLANAGSMMLASFTTLFLWQTFGLDPCPVRLRQPRSLSSLASWSCTPATTPAHSGAWGLTCPGAA